MLGEVRANRNPLTAARDDREFRELAENIPTLCWMADAEGYILWYNRRWYDYTGTTPEAMQGWGWQSVHSPRDLAAVLERWSEAIAGRRPFELVLRIRGADGIFRPFLTRISPAFGPDGAVSRWFGVNTDISPQAEDDSVFARSEARFRVLADSMPQMVWCAVPDGRHDYFNAQWYEFTGAPVAATESEAWTARVHPDDRDRASDAWRRALETGAPLHIECRLRRRSGDHRWVLGRAHAETDARGLPARWYGTFTDIEDIVQARALVQRSRDELELAVAARTGERNLLATLVETTDVMIMAIDPAYAILAINRAAAEEFARLYGVRARSGDNVRDLTAGHPEAAAETLATWARALAGEEFTVVAPRGAAARVRRHYELTFRTLRDDAGAPIGAFQFVKDVTEQLLDQERLAQARGALVQSQKLEAMGQLTGGVAHDFNNLLTPIIGSLDILRRRGLGGDREQRLIHGAWQSAERAKVLVHRLLAFARRQPLQSMAVDIGALVSNLAELIDSTTGPQVTVTLEIDADLPPAKADPNQLEMAIINLCVNARDAMNDGGGTVRISARRARVAGEAADAGGPARPAPGDYVRLSVADTGRGMDEATLARAVEPFFSTKGIGRGTGLGLSMAHGLAAQLGGALTIASQPGLGADVSIWLPTTQEPPPSAAESRVPADGPLHAGAALLVDDEEYIRLSTADMLADLGFRVHEAASGEAALTVMDAGLAPDLLITDHLMPGMTGVELARAVRARRPQTRVLIVSGFAEAEGIDPGLPRLTKPFVQSDLAAALAELVGRRG
jgi:PAS domain S-box-containing protein